MTRGELTCQELVELVTDYLENALAEAERMRFERHVLSCDGCEAYLAQFRRAIDVSGRVREEDVPGETLDALAVMFRGWVDGAPR